MSLYFPRRKVGGGTMKPTTGRHGEDHSARFMFAGAVWRVAFPCDFPHVGVGGSGAGLGGVCGIIMQGF